MYFSKRQWLGVVLACTLAGVLYASTTPANLTSFGRASIVDPPNTAKAPQNVQSYPVRLNNNAAWQIEWDHPRDVRTITLEWAGTPPKPEEIGIEWWRRIWPENGSGGWMKLDDPFNGQWTKTLGSPQVTDSTMSFAMPPLTTNEAPGIKRTGFSFRRTYKLRISTAQSATLQQIQVCSDAVERQARLRFEWGVQTKIPGNWSPKFEAANGRIVRLETISSNAAIVEVSYADATNRLSTDRGLVTFRSGEPRSFSVFVDDVLREGGLFVRDIGVFVSNADLNLTHASWSGPKGDVWRNGTIMEQVSRMPEQSFEGVMQAIPRKPVNYMFLGAPNLRQEIALGPNGDIRLLTNSLRSAGPDFARRSWAFAELVYQFRSGTNPVFWGKEPRRVTRTLQSGWLPVATHQWTDDGIVFAQTSIATPLLESIEKVRSTNGCEPVVLVTQFAISNTNAEPRPARLWMQLNHMLPGKLETNGLVTLAKPTDGIERPGFTPVRGQFVPPVKGRLALQPLPATEAVTESKPAICYEVELAAGETQNLEFSVPYLEMLDARELDALARLRFAPVHNAVVSFWKERCSRGMTYEVPDLFLNEFFKASLWHVLVTTDIDPVTGHYQQGAATHHYRNYLNETMMIARSLEMRGEFEEAFQLIKPFLDSQGAKGLPGNFKTSNGVFYAAHTYDPDPYTAQGYNMHHGWGMWAVAEHFQWSTDTNYLRSVAEKLVQACDWVTREREATQVLRPDGSRPVEYGLAPAGDLEDVEEYLYWYATDAYYYLGMKQAAAVLSRIEHPDARRLTKDADAFLRDIQTSMAESIATTPVVRLRDGTYVPFAPPRAYALIHLKEGWIREGLYPALHLRDAEVYSDDHPYVDWMIQDQEDNIFLSAESGYGVKEARANFFHFGGFTLQPNLVDIPLAYLKRDQVPNFLRSFYNTAWASLYPETMCFAEWVPYYGRGGGPLFKTPDECKFVQWMRYMLIMERGENLELGLGVPRAWMTDGKRIKVERAATFFGQLDLEIVSEASRGMIRSKVRLQKTDHPKAIVMRLRSPDGKAIRSATVNGQPARVNTERQTIELPVEDSTWEIVAQF